jgi:hypothetical protein
MANDRRPSPRHNDCCGLQLSKLRLMPMLRALIDGFWVLYYRWALNALHPAHPDAGHVQLMHALYVARLERFLRRPRASRSPS